MVCLNPFQLYLFFIVKIVLELSYVFFFFFFSFVFFLGHMEVPRVGGGLDLYAAA